MTPQQLRGPRPIFGILAPGEETTRKFQPLPIGVMPLLQNFPGGSVSLVEQGVDFITVENTGPKRSPFTVLFVTQDQMKQLFLVKSAVDMVSEHRRKKHS